MEGSALTVLLGDDDVGDGEGATVDGDEEDAVVGSTVGYWEVGNTEGAVVDGKEGTVDSTKEGLLLGIHDGSIDGAAVAR